jgi:hypothetical protein
MLAPGHRRRHRHAPPAIETWLGTHPGDWVGAYRAFAGAVSPSGGSLTPPPGQEWYASREELNAEPVVRDDIPILTTETVDEAGLASTPVEVRFSHGTQTGAVFRDIATRLAAVRGDVPDVIEGAGHALYLHPDAAAAYLLGH